ncbi:hypothetical protein CLV62_107148 [Dysgonomonas alginatilytica]|uniref:Mobilization protein n=1 Tax=Dysgonomonas alginatilytica TaxID=1605892 RepID=A0A2V3PSQ9_9BACT|nr:hypothetical protein [Dysgonomonas alginatilytica]PXV65551.1 hypothetical protein CLV62_107148 [Dysgonomonas alginatilytica]
MNYKDPENILLIICGSTGIAALALIFRYLFILKWGFDAFGANLVFIIIFIVGLVFFISYLETIQKVIPPLFKRRKQIIENQDIIPEPDKVEDIEPTIETESEESIRNETPVINELDVIREKHEQDEITRKREVLEVAIRYTRTTFAPFADDQNINRLCEYIIQYSTGTELKDVEPIRVKDLQNVDLFHFGWNVWNHFRINKQDDIALFLKIVFAKNLKDVDADTIRKKLTFNEGKRKIRLQEKL